MQDPLSAVVQGRDEVCAGDLFVVGGGLEEEGEGAVFDGVSCDCGDVFGGGGGGLTWSWVCVGEEGVWCCWRKGQGGCCDWVCETLRGESEEEEGESEGALHVGSCVLGSCAMDL